MKALLFIILSVSMLVGIGDIAEINRLKKEAEQAYANGNFSTAIAHYQTLLDSFKVSDENIRLNLANAYLQSKDTATAQRAYSQLTNSTDPQVKSLAQQQLGIVAHDQQKLKESLQHFKEALKADPMNEDARYNYELLKKKLQDQQNQDQNDENQQQDQQKNQDQENQDQKDQQQQNQDQKQDQQQQDQQQQQQEQQQQQQQDQQEGQDQEQQNQEQQEQQQQDQGQQEEGESEEQNEDPPVPTAERLEDMNMSEEKARMILEAMRNNELQYIQQNRRKPKNPVDRNKPDW